MGKEQIYIKSSREDIYINTISISVVRISAKKIKGGARFPGVFLSRGRISLKEGGVSGGLSESK